MRTRRGTYVASSNPETWGTVEHLNGIPWYDCHKPWRWHRCWAQTRYWQWGSNRGACPCGALFSEGAWRDRNSRGKLS